MTKDDQADAAIRDFYAAATGQVDWRHAFDRMLEAAGFDGAAFYVVDRQSQRVLDERWHRLDPAYAETYLRDYVALDPRAAQVFGPAPRRILYDYLHTAEAAIDRDPFYAWFQASQRHRYYVGGQSRPDAALPLTLTLHRPRSHGHATPEECSRFSRLFDHFDHAVRLQHQLGLDATRNEAGLAELETDACGVVLLDAAGGVLHANAAALAITGRDDALGLAADGILARHPSDNAVLQLRIAATLAGRVTPPWRLARRFGGAAYTLSLYPLPRGDLLASAGCARAALRILDPDAGDRADLSPIAALLGLTRQEGAILALLLEGADPAEIAATAQLKPATVRTYLASIYRKAGVRRQAGLVASIASLRHFLAASRR